MLVSIATEEYFYPIHSINFSCSLLPRLNCYYHLLFSPLLYVLYVFMFVCMHACLHTAGIPATVQPANTHIGLWAAGFILSVAGIVFSVVCIVFNLVFRKKRWVYMCVQVFMFAVRV